MLVRLLVLLLVCIVFAVVIFLCEILNSIFLHDSAVDGVQGVDENTDVWLTKFVRR